jgi:hypothetical protein
MTRRTFFVFFLLSSLSFVDRGFSQSSACQVVPVSVINVNGENFRGLKADDFNGKGLKNPVAVKTVTFDDGPRRVLLVVDTGKKINSNYRKAEIEMLNAMVAAGRPGDSFAVIVTHGTNRGAKFGEDSAKFKEVLSQDFEAKSDSVGVLDAMMEGMEWFGAPVNGDSIVAIAFDLEGSKKTNPKSIAKALEDRRIRMFGLAMGPVSTRNVTTGGSMTSTTSQGLAWTTPGIGNIVYETGDENFFPLAANSGGLVRGVLGQKQSINFDEPQAKAMVVQKARQIFNTISAFYLMEVEPPARAEEWKLDVVERVHKVVPQMWVLYPHKLGPC